MAYPAKVFKIMIASPGDVEKERQIARDVIHEWNAVNSEHRRIVLLPIGWETHSVPEMGERPQEIINRQILRDCDMLIAAFWTRLGTPTGTSKSGTVEEIEEHIAAGKPTMIYFSSQPVTLESVDSDQYQRLRDFRDTCEKRGLIEKYESLSEFRAKLTRQLSQATINKLAGEPITDDAVGQDQNATQNTPQLSALAREMLTAAAHDPNGDILRLGMMGGTVIQSNGIAFAKLGDARSEAEALAALEQLEEVGLIRDRGYKREIFTLTDSGFRAADQVGEPNR